METPERIGEFRILRVLGQGGMGIVYEAEQESLNRRVALKVLPRGALRDRNQLQRFEIESRSAARLQHSNIVPVYGVGEHEGTHYYVMQFIEGQGLDQVLVELRLIRQMRRSGSATQDEPAKDPTNRFSGESASAAAIALSLYPNPFTVVDSGTLRR